MAVGDYCTRDVVIVSPDADVASVAELMREYAVGDLVVVRREGDREIPIGIVTDRDLVIKVLAVQVDPLAVTAGDLMSADLVTVSEEAELLDVTARMRRKAVRRVVVVDRQGVLVGILALDDVLELLSEEIGNLAQISYRQVEREERLRGLL